MKAQRRAPENTAVADWNQARDEEVARNVRAGLGIRPPLWWTFDSGHPELADAGTDAYAHLRPEADRSDAAARLHFLADSGELRQSELLAIATGQTAACEWRRTVLRGAER